MKKLILFLIMVFLVNVVSLAQSPQHYNYDTTGINNSFPFDVQSGKQVQWLILPGEFNRPVPVPSGKSITAVYFFMAGTSTKQLWHLNISMGQTGLTSLPNGEIYRGPLTTVYYRTIDTLHSSAGTWMRIQLDKPFLYDTSLSLVIEVSQSASSGSGSMTLKQTVLSGIRRCFSNLSGSYCNYSYSNQDNYVANCGIDVVPAQVYNYYWGSQNSSSTNSLLSVKSVSNLVGWAVGGSAIRRTTNGGTTWIDCNPAPGNITGEIHSIEATNADTAFCTSKSPAGAFIYRTTNGGTNWTQVFTQNNGFVNAVHFTSSRHGYAVSNPVGGNWVVWYSVSCGAVWDTIRTVPQNGNESGWNNSLVFTGNYAWFGTNNSRVYKAYNPVCVWIACPTAGLANSMSVHFNSNSLGLAGGNSLVRTTDGGQTWQDLNSVPGSGNILGIDGNGNDFWFIRGSQIYMSTNCGDDWSLCYTASDTLYDINFALVNGCPEGWAVGRNGIIIRMSSDSLIGIGNHNISTPSEYKLFQNYPNPFNPVTKIKFDLPSAGQGHAFDLQLIVYDVLGREIAVLLNKKLSSGTYDIEWDGSNYPSGVYFYTLKCSDFTASKKMLLIK
jgi:photosystem II stability/assembly factor-like uncharacterized protein